MATGKSEPRLGILGGTFDPIHFGHLRLAEEVGESLNLEHIYLIPAALPPHKGPKTVSLFRHRLEMTRIASAESPLLKVLDLEARREGFSYSIETLKTFHTMFQPDLDLHFVLGMDAFLEIETWKDFRNLFNYAHFVVIQRPGFPSDILESFLPTLGVSFDKRGQGGNRFLAPSGYEVISMEATLMDISSTKIREKVAGGKSIRFLVPEAVRSYIKSNDLYRSHETD
jgi:nicotinate-nucleotide adenylyltransferase